MEHLTDQETHGSSQLTATSPQPSPASVQPGRRVSLNGDEISPPSFHLKPASDSNDKDSLSSSKLILHLGCDSDEDEEEELRNVKEDKENRLLLPASQDLKLCTRFTLTPVAGRRESEGSREVLDLTTPHQGISKSVDCPERPSKIHRTSTSHAESSTSCRLLFSSNMASPPTIIEEGESNDHRHFGLAATSQHSMPPHFKDGSPPLSTSLTEQALIFKGDGEELPTPIHSPRFSPSSSCSDCDACSSASSVLISSSSPLSPPLFFLLNPAKFNVASSAEEELEILVKDQVMNPPCDTEDMSQECRAEDQNPHDSAEGTKEEVKGTPVCALDEVKEAEEVVVVSALPVPVKMQSEPMEVSFAPSSTGSVHSNWTAISGISPLPSSDPTHLHHHQHRHHHCHHHHGHHHHRHTTGKIRDKAANYNDILVTSTPIHQRHVAEGVNVSSVTPSQDVFVEPSRFFVSSELMSPEPHTETENDLITSTASSDTKHRDQCPASIGLPVLLQGDSSHSTALGDTQLKSLRNLSENSNAVRTEDREGEMQCNIKKRNKRTDKEEPHYSPVKTRKLQPRPLFVTKSAKSRPLTKKEARILSLTPVNFSESFLIQEDAPSHCHSFTFGQSLHGGSVERKLSVSM